MKKAKKIKVRQRRTELDRLAAQVRKVLRRTTRDAIEIGNLLIKSRKYLEHGEWQDWLAENFDLSLRTAQNYFAGAEYVARQKKIGNVADFANLSATVLYGLAAGNYNEQVEAAILAATREGRVDEDAAWAICERLEPIVDDDVEDTDDQDDGGETTEAEDAEINAILDGPPPDVPPAPNASPPDFALRDFDAAIDTLKRLMTKLAAQFASSSHSADDLEQVECFIRAVRAHTASPR
jgi:Protein of unknown function (DUF3102)